MTYLASMSPYSSRAVAALCHDCSFLPGSGSRQQSSIMPFIDDGASKLVIHNGGTIEFRSETFAHRLGRKGAVLAGRALVLISAIGSKVSVAASHIWQQWPSFSLPGAQAEKTQAQPSIHKPRVISNINAHGDLSIIQTDESLTITEDIDLSHGEGSPLETDNGGLISAMGVAESLTVKKKKGSIIRCPGKTKTDIPFPANVIEMSNRQLVFKDRAGKVHTIKEQGKYEIVGLDEGGLEVQRVGDC